MKSIGQQNNISTSHPLHNEQEWMTALELATESYKEEYDAFLRENGLLESEDSALAFIQEYESDLDL